MNGPITAKRALAVVAAAGMIVGAVFLRNYLDDRDGGTSTTGTDQPTNGGSATVICSTEFRAVCDQLDRTKFDVTVESAGATLDKLVNWRIDLPDAWITLDPFPGMVDEYRRGVPAAALAADVTPVATDVPQLAVPTSRAEEFAVGCSGERLWSCVGTAAGQQWSSIAEGAANGQVLPGLSDPSREAIGLVSFANAVAGYFNSPDLDSSAWTDTGFRSWYRNLSARRTIADPGVTALRTLIVRQSRINVAATSRSETSASASKSAFTAVDVSPAVPIIAVVATYNGNGDNVIAPIRSLLIQNGWTRAGDPPPSLPAGTFVALRQLWEESN